MKSNLKLLALSGIAASLMLAGCGGGSGGSSPSVPVTPPVVKTCANGAADYPTCTPAIVPADLQLTVAIPPFASGSQDLIAFNYLNDARTSLGLGKWAYNAELTKTASNHANYLSVNKILSHLEDPLKAGFTGVTQIDRAAFAGYATSGYVSEVIAAANTSAGAVQRLIDTVYHRGVLFNQSYRDFGFATYCTENFSIVCLVLNPGYKTPQRNASDFVMIYPKDGQSNITLSMGGESPNPFPEIAIADAQTKIGYPISFAVEASQILSITSFTMTESGGSGSLDTWLLTNANDLNNLVGKNEAYLTAKGALKPSTTYNISFFGTANGKDVSRKWSFTTASSLLASF